MHGRGCSSVVGGRSSRRLSRLPTCACSRASRRKRRTGSTPRRPTASSPMPATNSSPGTPPSGSSPAPRYTVLVKRSALRALDALPATVSPELARLATPAGVAPLGVAPLLPLRVGGRVPPVLACLSLALPAFAGTLECPPESVRVGPACIDKYEASVWNIPA